MAATLALPASYRTAIAEALSTVRRPVLIWRQFQDCAGNSESILRSPQPDVAQIVLETLVVELPRADHGRLGRAGRGAEYAGRAGAQGPVHRGDRGRDPDRRGLLHDRRTLGARPRAGGGRQREVHARGRRLCVGRWARPARSDRRAGRAGRGAGRQRREPRRAVRTTRRTRSPCSCIT